MESHVSDTWQAMGVTHGKPCVHLHVFTRHVAIHVSTWMEGASCINGDVRRRRGRRKEKRKGGKEKRKGGKKRKVKKKKKKNEKKEKEERKRKEEK